MWLGNFLSETQFSLGLEKFRQNDSNENDDFHANDDTMAIWVSFSEKCRLCHKCDVFKEKCKN